jgi:hypothetical protein
MSNYRAEDILRAWESTWGPLPGKWRQPFLNHRAMAEILFYPENWIEIAVVRNKKLEQVLEYLQKNENRVEPKEYRPQILETDEAVNKIIKSFGNEKSTPIPENDWWRDQV